MDEPVELDDEIKAKLSKIRDRVIKEEFEEKEDKKPVSKTKEFKSPPAEAYLRLQLDSQPNPEMSPQEREGYIMRMRTFYDMLEYKIQQDPRAERNEINGHNYYDLELGKMQKDNPYSDRYLRILYSQEGNGDWGMIQIWYEQKNAPIAGQEDSTSLVHLEIENGGYFDFKRELTGKSYGTPLDQSAIDKLGREPSDDKTSGTLRMGMFVVQGLVADYTGNKI